MSNQSNLFIKIIWRLVEIVLVIVVGLSSGLAGSYFGVKYFSSPSSPGSSTETVKTQVVDEQSSVIDVVEKNKQSVVSIVITKNVPVYEQYYSNPFSSDFFGSDWPFTSQKQVGEEEKEVGAGSGFIVSEDGMIVTNKHVVEDESADYTVILENGDKLSTQVLARDPYLDLAVLKVDKHFDQYIKLGDSGDLKVGQSVIAIGYSLGQFEGTVSTGIISGLSRQVTAGDGSGTSEVLDDVIQTDAAINPGNSGGPLLDINGNAIGINVAMAEGAENIGFSIPINNVKTVVESVKTNGKIVRPYLGVRYVPITSDIQKENNLSVDYGVLITRGEKSTDLAVTPGGPADKAGLQENDIILEIDGQKLTSDVSLQGQIIKHQAGDEVNLRVLSKGSEKDVTVKLESKE